MDKFPLLIREGARILDKREYLKIIWDNERGVVVECRVRAARLRCRKSP